MAEESWSALNEAQAKLTRLFAKRGYRLMETPILEPTELFFRKGGGEMASQMYSFTDPGGNQVSLRPEYTSSIVRSLIEMERLPALPVRVQYAGPVFRYSDDSKAYRQFNQAGVELIGSGEPEADSEVLGLACQGLASMAAGGVRLVLGDLSLFNELLESQGLSERARVFVLSQVGLLREGGKGLETAMERARRFRLLGNGKSDLNTLEAFEGLSEAPSKALISSLLHREEPGALGQRRPDEISERLMRKLQGGEDPRRLEKALELSSELAGIRGEPGKALKQARVLFSASKLPMESVERLESVMSLLEKEDMGGAEVTIDLGLARGIAYYTGIVFEIMDSKGEASLGGGGRYDGLSRAMGGSRDLAALGFAYTLDRVLEKVEA
jgi:histidyl-tRNA synthetase